MAIADDDIVKARNARAMAEAANAANAGAVAAASDPLTAFLDYAKTRPAELDTLATQAATTATTAAKDLAAVETPALNNRNAMPTTDPGSGYKWQWFSMAKTNNPYGGE